MTNLPAPIKPELVRCNMTAGKKEEALREMVQLLASAEPSIVIEDILQALDERERQGPFSIAKGVAFPHARTEGVQEFTIVIGTKPEGLDFRARDGQAVRIVVLFVIPKIHSNLYLRTLAWFLNHFQEEARMNHVSSLSTPEEVIAALGEKDTLVKSGLFHFCPFTVTTETPLRSILAIMAENRLEAVPVLSPEDKLAGEITLANLFRTEPLRESGKMENLLEKSGDLSIEKLVTTDGYLPVEKDRTAFDLAKEMAEKGLPRAYRVTNGSLRGMATLSDLLHRCWKKE